jgi:hypothetical protein
MYYFLAHFKLTLFQPLFVPQQQQNLPGTTAAPIYSPFAYSQPNAPVPQQQPPPMHQAPPQQPIQVLQQQPYTNPVNFFNPNPSAHFNDTTNNNNPLSAFNSVQSPIQTPMTTIAQQPAPTSSPFNPSPSVNPYSNFQTEVQTKPPQFASPHEAPPHLQQQQKASFTPPPPLSTANNAPPSNSFYDPSQQDMKNMNFVQQQHPPVYHQQQAPYQEQSQFNQWNDQTQQQQQQFMSWQTQAAFSHPQQQQQQQPPVSSNSSNDWERISPDSIQFLQQQAQQQQQASNAVAESFSQPPRMEESQVKREEIQPTIFTPPSASNFHQMSPAKVENLENIQTPAAELPLTTSYNPNPSFMQPTIDVYPENRERLDEVPPLRPPSSSSSIDRHNYLVTGQLSNENIQQMNPNPLAESFPPPGLSRLVVGEPESNQENLPSGHRMVTGNEMTPASYLNYQRQADGEVSQAPSMIPPVRPPSHPPSFAQPHHVEHEQMDQQNFNVGDRNLYLVAGESDLNSQRVIPGVESDNNNVLNNVASVINPLQNLHIEDDDDFVNISVSSQHRNVDGDGMEEQNPPQRQIANASEQREEDIEGANDNNLENAAISMPIAPSNEPVREDIEGANDPLPAVKSSDIAEPRKSFDKKLKPESSEDSELREVERNAKMKPRRSKKYNSNYSDSENDEEDYKDRSKRDKYDDRYKKTSTRERAMTRDEYEKYRRREKERERRSGGGSRYESTRRTDDEEDGGRRRTKKTGRDSRGGEGEDESLENRERRRKDKKKSGKRSDYDDEDRDRGRRGGRPRPKQGGYDEDYPSGRRSNNDRRYDHPYYQGFGGGYDPNLIYQQQQYFEMLRRTNPQYYEYYKNYYSMMQQQQQMQVSSAMHNPPSVGAMDDIGGSLRSGYNSSTERDR